MIPQEFIDIGDFAELLYENVTADLQKAIAKHLLSGAERTAFWEAQKLGEMGALNEESVKIIAKHTGKAEKDIQSLFEAVAQAGYNEAGGGYLQNVAYFGTTAKGQQMSPQMEELINAYTAQAVEKWNLTNQTMLQSTMDLYLWGMTEYTAEEDTMQGRVAEAQRALEAGAFEIASGRSRVEAMRSYVQRMVDMGLPGFYDKTGRRWSAEAYTSMVLRTTAHNVYIQAIKDRQQAHGSDIFQVSSHSGARPLCYPYQGKIYSWDGAGVFTDGDGVAHEYGDIGDTSYGQAAGLFGINCGHYPIPLYNGLSYLQEFDKQSEEENRKEYLESQQQRALEREIRNCKHSLELMKIANAHEGVKVWEQKLKDAQYQMRGFLQVTGRPRRYDREQIGKNPLAANYKPKVEPKQKPAPTPASKPVEDKAAKAKRFQWTSDLYDWFGGKDSIGSRFKQWYDALKRTEIAAVRRYTGQDYIPMNSYLRGFIGIDEIKRRDAGSSKPTFWESIQRADKALSSFVLEEDIITKRGLSERLLNSLLKNGALAPGTEFQDKGFVSTSPTSPWSGYQMIIYVPKGTGHGAWVDPISANQGEDEFLLPRGSKFRITRVEGQKIYCDWIGSEQEDMSY